MLYSLWDDKGFYLRSKSCLDYCNGILSLVCSKCLEWLQITHISPMFINLLKSHVTYKVLLLTNKHLCALASQYHSGLLRPPTSSWSLVIDLLSIFKSHLRMFGNSSQCHSLFPLNTVPAETCIPPLFQTYSPHFPLQPAGLRDSTPCFHSPLLPVYPPACKVLGYIYGAT